MPTFVYRAADVAGRLIDGVLEGESEADVIRALEQRELTALAIRTANVKQGSAAADDGPTTIRLRLHELLGFTRELKVMLASGVTLLATLGLLRQRAKGGYRRLLDRIAADIQRGTTLSEALAAHPRTFDAFYVGTIRAGEAAGVHTEALDELIAYYERRAALRREITGALLYPAIVVATLIGACVVMLTFVVPQFESLFASSGAALPLPTRVLLAASGLLRHHYVWLVAGAVALGLAAWQLAPLPTTRAAVGRILSHVPLIGEILYLATVVQFARMIALLERSGLPLLETFKVVEAMLMHGPVKALTGRIRREVVTGSSITAAIAGTKVLPDLVEHMIAVGEETGRIDELLAAAAVHYEEQMRVKIRRLTTALEPILTLAVSSLVLVLALAVFLPIWETNRLLLKH